MESILTSIKKLLGIAEEYDYFDSDIIIHINSVFMILTQLGVGPEAGFSIRGRSEIWNDFLGELTDVEAVKTYMYLKVKSIFDPPLSGAALDSLNRTISELESRLNMQSEIRGLEV